MQEWLVEWQATRMFPVLTVEHSTEKMAVVLDKARFHHAKALTGRHEPGQPLERITPIHLPPYAPDHNPVEHVWNAAKNNIATIQHETPEETLGASAPHVTGRAFDHDFEHPHPRNQKRSCFMTARVRRSNEKIFIAFADWLDEIYDELGVKPVASSETFRASFDDLVREYPAMAEWDDDPPEGK